MNDTTFQPEQVMAQHGIPLPAAPKPLGNYQAWAISGNWIITAGQLPWVDGKLAYQGKLGSDLSVEDGYQAARIATINAIAQLKDALGSLSRVSRILHIEGTFQVAPGFQDHPKALDGSSDLMNLVFRERGRHCRMVYTNPEMPENTPVLIIVQAEIT